jgi:hypothetical protein
VQWNPCDERCVAGELLVHAGAAPSRDGELYAVEPRPGRTERRRAGLEPLLVDGNHDDGEALADAAPTLPPWAGAAREDLNFALANVRDGRAKLAARAEIEAALKFADASGDVVDCGCGS